MKLDDWIKPYGVDDQMEQTNISSEVVQYMIPSYKIDRLRDADESADLLEQYKELGTPEEIEKSLRLAKDTIIKLRDDLTEALKKNVDKELS